MKRKKIKGLDVTPLSNYKANVVEGIKKAVEEVKLIMSGKLKGISAKELLNELPD